MIIVTGGAGFIGSAMLFELNAHGLSDILVVDHLGSSSKWKNLVKRSFVDYLTREEFHALIVQDKLDAVKIEAIIHLGACSATTAVDCDFLMANNFHYTRDLAIYALKHKIRLIVASSAATYGDGQLGFSDSLELISKLKPLNMYGYKIAA